MATLFSACGGGASGQQIHRCAGAGRWFPSNPTQLKQKIEGYLNDAKVETPKGEVVAVVSPHAGYEYSGPVAAYGYATVRGKSYARVIVMGLSHRLPFRGVSALDADAYETPLGSIPVDRDCVQALLATKALIAVPEAHVSEWSDENQLPFLQAVLKPGWKLVPILVGNVGDKEITAAAEAIRPFIFGDTLLVIGTDFTHWENAKAAEQNKADLGAADLLVKKNYPAFMKYIEGPGETICGRLPLAVLLKLMDADCSGHLLQHRLSGEMTGDYSYSVGYCAIVYTTPSKKPAAAKAPDTPKPAASNNPGHSGLQSDKFLSEDEEMTLLKMARTALTEWIGRSNRKIDLSKFNLSPNLRRNAGAFVTLHKQGDLRGCIGYIQAIKPLYETVIENACNAASEDYRFSPIRKNELPDVDVEISVMSPLRPVKSVNEIVVGRHGLIIKKGFNQGVFLPQVPVEQGWNLEQYLDGICRKASLPRGAWKEGAELQVFTAQVFGEKEHNMGSK